MTKIFIIYAESGMGFPYPYLTFANNLADISELIGKKIVDAAYENQSIRLTVESESEITPEKR